MNRDFGKLYHAALQIMCQMNLAECQQTIVTCTAAVLGVEHCFLDVLDEERGVMITRAGTGHYQARKGECVDFQEGISQTVWKNQVQVVWTKPGLLFSGQSEVAHGIAAAVPLWETAQHRVGGVLGIARPVGGTPFTETDCFLLEQLAELAAKALDNAYQFNMVQKELMVRKWVEEAFRMSEERYKTLVENIGVGIALINRDMEIVSTNRQMLQWLPVIEPIIKTEACTHADWQDCGYPIYNHEGVPGGEREGQERIYTVDIAGALRHLRIVPWPILAADGQIHEVIEMVEDITERRKTEEEVLKLSRALAQSLSMVLITDVQGRIEYVNDRYLQHTGVAQEVVVGMSVEERLAKGNPHEVVAAVQAAIVQGQEWRGEVVSCTKAGGTYWALMSISPIRSANNQITHFVVIQEDITQAKHLQQELTDKNHTLEETLRELGQTQSRMLQQEKLAGIGQLAAGVAHEINNPLGFVISNFDMLVRYLERLRDILDCYRQWKEAMRNYDDATIGSWVERITKLEKEKKLSFILDDLPEMIQESTDGLERVGKIIKELRAFSRVDTLEHYEEYDLNSGIESTLLVARNEIKYHADVKLELANLPPIQAMGGAINQVLLNLLVNAAQAIKTKAQAQAGMGLITVKTYADEGFVYCEIEDSGTGISQDKINQIFNPFFTTKPVGQGTGLGLSISYDIITNKHHGEIVARSVEGEGATFLIKLPIHQQEVMSGENYA